MFCRKFISSKFKRFTLGSSNYLRLQEEEEEEGKREDPLPSARYYTSTFRAPVEMEELQREILLRKPLYHQIKAQFRRSPSAMKKSTPQECFHPPHLLLDLTEETGDVVCTACGAVVLERNASTAHYLDKPGKFDRSNVGEVDYSNSLPHLHVLGVPYWYTQKALDVIRDASSALKIDGEDVVSQTYLLFQETASALNIPFDKFIIQKKHKPHLAYTFFVSISRQRIFRQPQEIALIFDVTYKQMLKSENLNHSLRTWKHYRQPSIYSRPSQLIYIVCADFNLSYHVSSAAAAIIRDIESVCYGSTAERIIYQVLSHILFLLDPNHVDKVMMCELDHLRENILRLKAERELPDCFVPESVVIKHMMIRHLI